MELEFISRIEPSSGCTLSLDEKSGLDIAVLQRRQEEIFSTKLYFWGKIMGEEEDYLVAYALVPSEDVPTKKFYYCTGKDYTLRQLPVLSEEYTTMAKSIKGRFKGDPSVPLDGGEEDEDEDPESGIQKERFREIHRLTYTVQMIDRDVAVVPRGAFLMEASHKISKNRNYEGLSYEAAGDLRNYFHFRRPESVHALAALKRPGIIKAAEFLDPIATDKPDGIWSLTYDASHTGVNLRSFYWPGYFFFHKIGTIEYGGVYFGDGLANEDLAFML
uniref:Radial spoke head protein 9 homolog n=1 Tax=Fibrocapsa japonica TaxID=94617 RepID=A0A7S2V1U7_9STRA|mmetsp:Transcript_2127/g.3122  ORF Transcript_2127/g.3122 Transcript_2127/m.3122 type:complete len:274 (+) Transcript_2127:125-946(+)|eukprot:CAMPEP_0113944098 /NCGR_PEP_ID=MMETSP1339-20121228/30635_1 /TAXON_ID=94617 /ORGANISM="Fibrocapsa japonica" /LENGTH=273 /DNA_ID=CAMNT_0000949169 /DNA_START=116 /DNA_END=937 /DNA_ORIENTATION=- /assembly_acc=CAM_ASM_000762